MPICIIFGELYPPVQVFLELLIIVGAIPSSLYTLLLCSYLPSKFPTKYKPVLPPMPPPLAV